MKKPIALSLLLLAGTAGAQDSDPATGESPLRKKLALSPCNLQGLPADAQCGTYEVFENRAARAGRKIPLRVALIPANVPHKEPDAIVHFAGGPGESAVGDGSTRCGRRSAMKR